MLPYFYESTNIIEIGTDEVGRGPLFGRVYAASVILPKSDDFDHFRMKDSKKFHSERKIKQMSEYIKQNALAWSIHYETEATIDEINILHASQRAIRKSIINTYEIYKSKNIPNNDHKFHIIVDGNYFKPLMVHNKETESFNEIPYDCIVGGDNTYSAIAAASILAKVARDEYIYELCEQYPSLRDQYSIHTNKGYGAKKHLDGIKQYGITPWHRTTFGICKQYSKLNECKRYLESNIISAIIVEDDDKSDEIKAIV